MTSGCAGTRRRFWRFAGRMAKHLLLLFFLFCSFTWSQPIHDSSLWRRMGRWLVRLRRHWSRCWRPTQKYLRRTSSRCCGTTYCIILRRRSTHPLITPQAEWMVRSRVCLLPMRLGHYLALIRWKPCGLLRSRCGIS